MSSALWVLIEAISIGLLFAGVLVLLSKIKAAYRKRMRKEIRRRQQRSRSSEPKPQRHNLDLPEWRSAERSSWGREFPPASASPMVQSQPMTGEIDRDLKRSIPATSTPQIDKNVQFTVYRPATIVPQRWYPLVAFAHLSKRRPNAPNDEPDPIQEVKRQAARILSDQPAEYESTRLERGFSVPRRGYLTFVPLIEDCEFNPPSQSVFWQKTVHKVEFEMKASVEADGREVEGQMTVYLGNIILAEVPLRINVDRGYVFPQSQQPLFEEASAEPYRKIFASYSHRDTDIVQDFEDYVQALGDEYLRDVRDLRSGEVWSERLEELIRQASVFQLFWSSHSMISPFVKQEWEYALGLNRNKFVRPVYWEDPLPKKEPDLPPETLKRIQFYKFPRHEGSPRSTQIVLEPSVTSARRFPPTSRDFPKTSAEPSLDAEMPPPQSMPTSLGHIAGLSVAIVFSLAVASFMYLGLKPTSGPPTNTIDYPTPSPGSSQMVRVNVYPADKLRMRGDVDTYYLVLTNEGAGQIRNLEITEHLPDYLEYVFSEPPAFSQDSRTIVWRVPNSTVPPRQPVAFKLTVRLKRDLKNGESVSTRPTVTYRDELGIERTIYSFDQAVSP